MTSRPQFPHLLKDCFEWNEMKDSLALNSGLYDLSVLDMNDVAFCLIRSRKIKNQNWLWLAKGNLGRG